MNKKFMIILSIVVAFGLFFGGVLFHFFNLTKYVFEETVYVLENDYVYTKNKSSKCFESKKFEMVNASESYAIFGSSNKNDSEYIEKYDYLCIYDVKNRKDVNVYSEVEDIVFYGEEFLILSIKDKKVLVNSFLGKEVFNSYGEIYEFNDNTFFVSTDENQKGYRKINVDGTYFDNKVYSEKEVLEVVERYYDCNNDYCVNRKDDGYDLIDVNNDRIIFKNYKYIDFYDDFIVVCDNSYIFIYDYDLKEKDKIEFSIDDNAIGRNYNNVFIFRDSSNKIGIYYDGKFEIYDNAYINSYYDDELNGYFHLLGTKSNETVNYYLFYNKDRKVIKEMFDIKSRSELFYYSVVGVNDEDILVRRFNNSVGCDINSEKIEKEVNNCYLKNEDCFAKCNESKYKDRDEKCVCEKCDEDSCIEKVNDKYDCVLYEEKLFTYNLKNKKIKDISSFLDEDYNSLLFVNKFIDKNGKEVIKDKEVSEILMLNNSDKYVIGINNNQEYFIFSKK